MLSAEITWDPVGLDDYRDTWTRLFRDRAHEPSASFEWTQALLHQHLRRGDCVALVVLRDGSAVHGLVPLVAERGRVSGLPLVTLAPISERYNTHSDLLLSSVSEEIVRCLLDALMSMPETWDAFRMSRLLDGSPLAECLEGQLRFAGLRYRARAEQPSFILRLPGRFEEYLAQRSAKFRSFLKRAERKLETAGRVEFRLAGRQLSLDAAYAELLSVETRSWKHGHGTAISTIRHQQGFYEELCRGMSEAGHLHLTLLSLDGRPIAYNLGLIYGGTYAYLKTSFDEAFRPYSPATVARARLVASLIDGGASTLDFPAEPYEWERQWTGEVRWHRSLLLFSPSSRGRFFGMLQRLRDAARSPRRTRSVDYANPRQLKPPSTP